MSTTNDNRAVACIRFVRRLRVVLIIPMVILELIALGIGWLLALTHKPTARRWAAFYMRMLPDGKWYYAPNAEDQVRAESAHHNQ